MEQETSRLCRLDVSSAPALARWKSAPEVNLYWADRRCTSVAEQETWLAQTNADHSVDTFGILDPTGRLVGYLQLFNVDLVNRRAEIRILIGEPDCWGRGHGTSAMRQALEYAFDHLNLHKVSLRVLAFNERAQRCYRSLGFTVDGILRDDWYRYGRYVDQILMCITAPEFRRDHPVGSRMPAAMRNGQ